LRKGLVTLEAHKHAILGDHSGRPMNHLPIYEMASSKMIRMPNTAVGTCATKPPSLLLFDTHLCGGRMTLGAAYRILGGLLTGGRGETI
jgi:hypothetical protein